MSRLRLIVPCLWLLVLSGMAHRADAQAFTWLEGEAPSAINVKLKADGAEHSEMLSGGKWLMVNIGPDNLAKEAPSGDVTIRYKFHVATDGQYEIWNRIGMEFIRSPFQWSVDATPVSKIEPTDLTTDVMELGFWQEAAWIKMGTRQLSAGDHTLTIDVPTGKDASGKPRGTLYASDAICIAKHFVPLSHFKPNEQPSSPLDLEAAKTVFNLPAPSAAAARSSVDLNGAWQLTRSDEQAPKDVATPIRDLPESPRWMGITVPSNKNDRPELVFAHRIWYRTKVMVPQACDGRSFHIVFPQNNLNTTVYVNGVYCGFNKNPFARFSIDVTKGIKPGLNEVWVGIKDVYYGYTESPGDPMKLRKTWNVPISYLGQGFQRFAYPVWNRTQSGILVTPTLVCAGPVNTDDVFVQPSVARHELKADVTVLNPKAAAVTGKILCEAVNAQGEVEKAFPETSFTVPANSSTLVSVVGPWDNPKLWWPDKPNMYSLRTTLKVDGKAIDTQDQSFGFREWSIDGTRFRLNGIIWNQWAELTGASDPKEFLTWYHDTNQRMMRFWGTDWLGMPPEQALDWFDRNGICVRRQGLLDGEAIGYMAIEEDPALVKLYGSTIKMDLMKNWQDQVVAQVKGERNHPSIFIWSIENEYLFINCINLYGGEMDKFEAAVKQVSDAVRIADPTRSNMTDGGAANKDNSMPVHGNHYVFDQNDGRYPDLAYMPNVTGGGRGRWVWDQKRPRFLGEDYFATGINPADYAMIGGEETFLGKAQARPAAGLITRMLTEGYRWAGYAAFHFWAGAGDAENYWQSSAPQAVFCRQWNWSFGSGQKVARTFGIFNDTHFGDPLTFAWTLNVAGKAAASHTSDHAVAAGTDQRFDETLEMPQVTQRTEAELVLTLQQGGKEVFRDTKAVSILPAPKAVPAAAGAVQVLDPAGTIGPFLKARGIAYTPLAALSAVTAADRVLIVGKDALSPVESTSSALAAWASSGRAVIVLEQKNPLRYQATPADMEAAQNEGRIAYAEDLNHPALRGLAQKDFFTWDADHVVYRNAYVKPTRGGKSLVQCGVRLGNTALVEIPAGKGVLLLSQLAMGEKLATNATAQQLLTNLIAYGASYKQEFRPVAAVLAGNAPLKRSLDSMGLQYSSTESPIEALSAPAVKMALVNATPSNLKALADNLPKVNAFMAKGGYLVLNGLTPEGLTDYNSLVGFNHAIRPFQRERVSFPAHKDPLESGLTVGDIVMLSGKRMFGWTSDEYTADDEFSYVVDLEDVAPFGKSDFLSYSNIVNGFTNADGWPLIINFPAPKDGSPYNVNITLPKQETLQRFTWVSDNNYMPTTKVGLLFDHDEKSLITYDVKGSAEAMTFDINPPHPAKVVTLRILDWIKIPDKGNVGIDNIWLYAQRPADWGKMVHPLLNIGAMVNYPRGAGGILLCNLQIKDQESVPANIAKKQTILATLLRNLQAPFSGGKSVIAGSNLTYSQIDLSKQANQFRNEKGWYGDAAHSFAEMPTNLQRFALVPYEIYDFKTSPVPNAVMLGAGGIPNNPAQEVKGIPVNLKADALFFLQAARIDARRNQDELKNNTKFEMARYIINYADGQTVEVPVYSEIDVENYIQASPTPIPGAQVAWTVRYADGQAGVAYSKQWNNPHPNVVIKSIDFVYGKDRRGVPALLAVTAGVAAN